jgi:hypothetical protein
MKGINKKPSVLRAKFHVRCGTVANAMQSLKIGAIYQLQEVSATTQEPNLFRIVATLREIDSQDDGWKEAK